MKRLAVAVPLARGRCQTCAAVRELTRRRAARCSWCRTTRDPWRGTADFLERLATVGVVARVYRRAERTTG